MEDNKIIELINSGDTYLFEKLIKKYQNKLFAFIIRIVRIHEDALDICQETFFKAFKYLKTFKQKSLFSTWLFQIGYNESRNFLKKQKRKREYEKNLIHDFKNVNDEFDKINLKETNDIILKIIDNIKDVYRVHLHLYYNEGKTYIEIAEILDTSINNVKSNLRRAKEAIKNRLKKEYHVYDIRRLL